MQANNGNISILMDNQYISHILMQLNETSTHNLVSENSNMIIQRETNVFVESILQLEYIKTHTCEALTIHNDNISRLYATIKIHKPDLQLSNRLLQH